MPPKHPEVLINKSIHLTAKCVHIIDELVDKGFTPSLAEFVRGAVSDKILLLKLNGRFVVHSKEIKK